MADEAAMKEAIQAQALRLRNEFANLEEIRNNAKPFYDQFSKQAQIHFSTPYGICRVWWETDHWVILSPDGKFAYAHAKGLRKLLIDETQRLKDEAIMGVMELQIERLRSEYGDLEEFLSWARPIYDHELGRAELRFDTPVGVCRVWWEHTRWAIQLPDGGVTYSPQGSLRENLSLTRKYLRQGII